MESLRIETCQQVHKSPADGFFLEKSAILICEAKYLENVYNNMKSYGSFLSRYVSTGRRAT